jgi:2-polyprenyl-6-methoxyphenol hydroxylase-like FAD-dependent oxidoreductase
MNLGLREAVTLGDALSVALREGREDKLDEWAADSRAKATQVVKLTHRLPTGDGTLGASAAP